MINKDKIVHTQFFNILYFSSFKIHEFSGILVEEDHHQMEDQGVEWAALVVEVGLQVHLQWQVEVRIEKYFKP